MTDSLVAVDSVGSIGHRSPPRQGIIGLHSETKGFVAVELPKAEASFGWRLLMTYVVFRKIVAKIEAVIGRMCRWVCRRM